MHIITPEYCKSIAKQLNDIKSMTTPCKTMLLSLLRAFWLMRNERFEDAEKHIVIAVENLIKHYNFK